MALHPVFKERSIDDFEMWFLQRRINLSPGFQRHSVWSLADRRRLIQSLLEGYPVPSVFLYGRNSDGKAVYDVIDGKQRLETILMFLEVGRFKGQRFDVNLDLGQGIEAIDSRVLKRRYPENWRRLKLYSIQTVELAGDLNEIIDVFVRINSTGKRLTSQEKRHARFYNSRFLIEAEKLVKRFGKYLVESKIINRAQMDRMKGTELFSELLISIEKQGPINKKSALDRTIGNESINGNTLTRLSREFVRTIGLVRKVFPEIKRTRFHTTVQSFIRYSCWCGAWTKRS